jgi:hypothetical protein
MSVRFPVEVSPDDCAGEPMVRRLDLDSPLRPGEPLACPVGPLDRSFSIHTDHPLTARLLERLWGCQPAAAAEEPQIRIQKTEGLHGRYVDPERGWQLLSYDYAPFTIVKQALRWRFALECTETPYLPLHGTVLRVRGRRLCITGVGGAGKSHLAETWIGGDPEAAVLIEDWCLLELPERRLHPVSERWLHAKGTAVSRPLLQTSGPAPELIEVCQGSPSAPESRHLVDRRTLSRFADPAPDDRLDAILVLQGPFAGPFRVASSPEEARAALRLEKGLFWDKSNRYLPEPTLADLWRKWEELLAELPSAVAGGYAGEGAFRLIREVEHRLLGA